MNRAQKFVVGFGALLIVYIGYQIMMAVLVRDNKQHTAPVTPVVTAVEQTIYEVNTTPRGDAVYVTEFKLKDGTRCISRMNVGITCNWKNTD